MHRSLSQRKGKYLQKICTYLLHQPSELKETAKRLCAIRGAKTGIDTWFQNRVPMRDTTKIQFMTHTNRILLQSPPFVFLQSRPDKKLQPMSKVCREKLYQKQSISPNRTRAGSYRVHSYRTLLQGTEMCICWLDRESQEGHCLPGEKVQKILTTNQ